MNQNRGRGFPQIVSTTARFGQALLGSLFLISRLLKIVRCASVASLIAGRAVIAGSAKSGDIVRRRANRRGVSDEAAIVLTHARQGGMK